MPVMQLLLIPLAADYEVKHISIAIVDQDHSSDSQRLIQKVGASSYFRIVATPRRLPRRAPSSSSAAAPTWCSTIPPHFERDLATTGHASLQLVADAVNGVRAGLGTSYAAVDGAAVPDRAAASAGRCARRRDRPRRTIEVTTRNWYNPHVNYPLVHGAGPAGHPGHDGGGVSVLAQHRAGEGGRDDRADQRHADHASISSSWAS